MMGKELSEMTLEELWDLFPIFLVQHDDQWNGYYEEIEEWLKSSCLKYDHKFGYKFGEKYLEKMRKVVYNDSTRI